MNENSSPPVFKPRIAAAIVLVLLWAFAGLLNAKSLSWLETLNVAGLLVALAGVAAVAGAARLAATAAGRLWTAGVFLTAALLLSPAFHPALAAGLPGDLGACAVIFAGRGAQAETPAGELLLRCLGFLAPLVFAVAFCLLRRPGQEMDKNVDGRAGVADDLESFFSTRAARLNLAAFSMLVLLAELALSGTPMRAAITRGAALAAAFLALRPLLACARSAVFVRALNAGLGLALAVALGIGACSYVQLLSAVNAGNALLEQGRPDEAGKMYQRARDLNRLACSPAPEVDIETHWARFYEQKGAFGDALGCWNRVADLEKLDHLAFLPVLRVQCKQGDSATAWRRLVYQGFSAITDPELAPGIKALADASHDARAKLLAALLAWELNEPKEERQRRLEDVQRLAPHEPTSHTLLARLGRKPPDAALWLPDEFLVGERPTQRSFMGTLEELGSLQTLVALDPGSWELDLKARGTPLREEWPIIRVEFNGREIGRTQVNRSKDYAIPFTFQVNRGDLYHVRIVFENRCEEMDQGHMALRGLAVSGISFQRTQAASPEN